MESVHKGNARCNSTIRTIFCSNCTLLKFCTLFFKRITSNECYRVNSRVPSSEEEEEEEDDREKDLVINKQPLGQKGGET